jgi:hypothetical protein
MYNNECIKITDFTQTYLIKKLLAESIKQIIHEKIILQIAYKTLMKENTIDERLKIIKDIFADEKIHVEYLSNIYKKIQNQEICIDNITIRNKKLHTNISNLINIKLEISMLIYRLKSNFLDIKTQETLHKIFIEDQIHIFKLNLIYNK